MGVIVWIKDAWTYLTNLGGLTGYCLRDVGRFDECDSLWAAVGIALAIVCLLTMGFIALHFTRAYAAHRRVSAQRKAELVVASPEVMEQVKWTGENALDADLSQKEIIARIREAKARLRSSDASTPGNKADGDKARGIDVPGRR